MGHSGYHDLGWDAPCPCNFDLNVYEEGLRKGWQMLSEEKASKTKLIWKSTTPKFIEYECGQKLTGVGNPGVKLMNEVATAVAKKYGAHILDQWLVRYLDPMGGDGHHCMGAKSCKWSIAQLLNTIHAPN